MSHIYWKDLLISSMPLANNADTDKHGREAEASVPNGATEANLSDYCIGDYCIRHAGADPFEAFLASS